MKLLILIILVFATNANAEIYKCGNTYSQNPCGNGAETVKIENAPPVQQHSTGANIIKVLTGKVISVADGDTITIATATGKEKIRFAQIDTPEVSHFGSTPQPYGKESRMYLRQIVMNQNVRVEVEAVDQYGQMSARFITISATTSTAKW